MSGTLYTYADNFKAQKVLIASKYANSIINVPEFEMGVTNSSESFLKKFPLGKVPAFENDTVKLTESNAIAYYVGNEQTRGGDQEALVLEWIGFADNVILPHACNWVYPTLGIMQYVKSNTETAKVSIKKALDILNNHLSSRTWLVGERITQADISVACTLLMLYKNVLEPSFREPFCNVNRWFITAINQPHFKAVLGDVSLCEKMAQFDSKKYNEIHGKKSTQKPAASGDGKKKAQSQEKIKEETTKDPPKTKKPDPWVNLPPTKYDMESFKRWYRNESEETWVAYFWEHFDKEHYSIWHMKYKYNDEFNGVPGFLASNLVGGMLQRLDHPSLRKNAFGICLVLKTEKGYDIEGLWFWRGTGLVFELDTNWQVDCEHYDWRKLEPECDETKNYIKAYWSAEDDLGGKMVSNKKMYL